jgi:hypothetical protein
MKEKLILAFLFLSLIVKAQNVIEWDKDYKLQLSDFESSSTQIGGTNINSLFSGAKIDFSYYMSSMDFIFTKNFNSKVNCSFNKTVASLIAPDSSNAFNLLYFSRYDFDLSELYARKFRKRLFEEKGTFSDVSFFNSVFDEIQKEYVERNAKASTNTELGKNRDKLNELHQEVLKELELLSDFCKLCKPKKNKK